MHHLSDAEFRQAREDIYEGMKGYVGQYAAYGRLGRGFLRLAIPPDDMPKYFQVFYHVAPVLEQLIRYDQTLEEIRTARSPSEILEKLGTLNDITEEMKRLM